MSRHASSPTWRHCLVDCFCPIFSLDSHWKVATVPIQGSARASSRTHTAFWIAARRRHGRSKTLRGAHELLIPLMWTNTCDYLRSGYGWKIIYAWKAEALWRSKLYFRYISDFYISYTQCLLLLVLQQIHHYYNNFFNRTKVYMKCGPWGKILLWCQLDAS